MLQFIILKSLKCFFFLASLSKKQVKKKNSHYIFPQVYLLISFTSQKIVWLTYHTSTHAGLSAAQPWHGGWHCHLLVGKGTGTGLGDVGVRRAVIHIIRTTQRKQDVHCSPFKSVSWMIQTHTDRWQTCETPCQSRLRSRCKAELRAAWTRPLPGHHEWMPALFH